MTDDGQDRREGARGELDEFWAEALRLLRVLARKQLGRRAPEGNVEELAARVRLRFLEHRHRGGMVARFMPWAITVMRSEAQQMIRGAAQRNERAVAPQQIDCFERRVGVRSSGWKAVPSLNDLIHELGVPPDLPQRLALYLRALLENPGASARALAKRGEMTQKDEKICREALAVHLPKWFERVEGADFWERQRRMKRGAGEGPANADAPPPDSGAKRLKAAGFLALHGAPLRAVVKRTPCRSPPLQTHPPMMRILR
jgi:DNA-directed RNA polymerase specialized sigma24 family protein